MANESATVIAVIALVVAGVSFTWTVVWSVLSYRLLGARLRVRLTLGLLTHRGTVATFGSARRWPRRPFDKAPISKNDLWVEVVQITVANIGRTAAQVSQLGLDFGRTSHWRRHRLSMTVQPLAISGGRGDNQPVRLEPGDSTSIYVTVEDAVTWAVEELGRRRILVRACATSAGIRIRRSPRRRAWRVSAAEMRYPHLPVTKEVRLYRELLTSWPTSDLSELYEAYLQVRLALEDRTRGQLVDILEPFVPNVMERIDLAHRLETIGPFPKIIHTDDGTPVEVVTTQRPADDPDDDGQGTSVAD